MDDIVRLVNEYSAFAKSNEQNGIEDFCRYILFKKNNNLTTKESLGGVSPPSSMALLLKIIGRLHQLNMHFSTMALENCQIKKMEEFSIMISVANMKSPKKSEVIFTNLFEMSSGIDIINRLLKKNLLKENVDTQDKRSKRLQVTQTGEIAIKEAMKVLLKNAEHLTHYLDAEDIELCINILKYNEEKIFKLWLLDRKNGYDEMVKKLGS